MDLSCATCAADRDPGEVTWTTVRSSEREFEHERFTVWRCPACRCIHACEDVDLDRYYERYGLHATELDLLERLFYRNKLRFIRSDVAGYDPYSRAHADPGVLGRRYRLVLSTDVIEHVPSPAEHLERNGGLVALNEPFRWSSLRRPSFWWRGLTGGFVNRTDEVQLILRRPG